MGQNKGMISLLYGAGPREDVPPLWDKTRGRCLSFMGQDPGEDVPPVWDKTQGGCPCKMGQDQGRCHSLTEQDVEDDVPLRRGRTRR